MLFRSDEAALLEREGAGTVLVAERELAQAMIREVQRLVPLAGAAAG